MVKTQAQTKNGSHEKRWDGRFEQAHRHGKKKVAAEGHQLPLRKIDDPARPVDQYKSAAYQAVERSQNDRVYDYLHINLGSRVQGPGSRKSFS